MSAELQYDVELRGVTKTFGDFLAVDNVSLGVEKGQFLTLLGPSGCGKTTTLRMIAGFIHPTRGEIYIGGELMGTRPPYKRDSSMVFQDYALFPHMTVFENIAFGLKERRMRKPIIQEKVERMLASVGLEGLADRKPSQLSGGQRQRVALARSLVLEPTVLLLDEPLGALDLKLRKQMQMELKRIQEQIGITFIYVTHDQEEALVMSDQIAVMNKGRIEQLGSSREVYETPRTKFVADFIGETNLLRGPVRSVTATTARLDLQGIEVLVSHTGKVQAGDLVHFSIRPEKIVEGKASEQCETILEAEVVEVIYKGSVVRYRLELTTGESLFYEEQTKYHPQPYQVHTRLTIGWRTEDALVIEEAGA